MRDFYDELWDDHYGGPADSLDDEMCDENGYLFYDYIPEPIDDIDPRVYQRLPEPLGGDKRFTKEQLIQLPAGSILRRHYTHLNSHEDHVLLSPQIHESKGIGLYYNSIKYERPQSQFLADGGIDEYSGGGWSACNWTELISIPSENANASNNDRPAD